LEENQAKKHFIIYNIKIKSNTPYPILFLEVELPHIKSKVIIRYIIYSHKVINTKNKKLHRIVVNSNESHMRLKKGWHKDIDSWLNNWRIKGKHDLQNIDIIKALSQPNLKRNFCATKK